jgi:sortase (surface protein transpeptidase)
LLDAEGKTAKYIVSETKRVLPNAVEEVLPTDHEVVTVYTCTGFLDSQRFVVKALPSESNIAAQ